MQAPLQSLVLPNKHLTALIRLLLISPQRRSIATAARKLRLTSTRCTGNVALRNGSGLHCRGRIGATAWPRALRDVLAEEQPPLEGEAWAAVARHNAVAVSGVEVPCDGVGGIYVQPHVRVVPPLRCTKSPPCAGPQRTRCCLRCDTLSPRSTGVSNVATGPRNHWQEALACREMCRCAHGVTCTRRAYEMPQGCRPEATAEEEGGAAH